MATGDGVAEFDLQVDQASAAGDLGAEKGREVAAEEGGPLRDAIGAERRGRRGRLVGGGKAQDRILLSPAPEWHLLHGQFPVRRLRRRRRRGFGAARR